MTWPSWTMRFVMSPTKKTALLRPVVAMAALAAAAVVLPACTAGTDTSKERPDTSEVEQEEHFDISTLEPVSDIQEMVPSNIEESGTLRVTMALDYVPAEFLLADGTPAGYSVDLASALGRVMGVEVSITDVPFPDLPQEIEAEEDTIGISSLTITPERLAKFEMVSYMQVGSVFAVARGNPSGFDPDAPCGATVGVQEQSYQLARLQRLSNECVGEEKAPLTIEALSPLSDIIPQVMAGKVDAVFADSGALTYVAEDSGGKIVLIGDIIDPEAQGVAVNKENEQLTVVVQAALQYLMDQGYLERILDAYGMGSLALPQARISPDP